MSEIQKGDRAARRTFLLILAGAALFGVVGITIAARLRPSFEAWVREDVDVRLRMVLAAATLLTAGPALGMSVYLWRLGRRTIHAGRYPPPGLRVVRDTPVMLGNAASRLGRLLQAFAVVIALAGVVLALLLWRLTALIPAGAAPEMLRLSFVRV